jgi:hypothetical protein
MDVPAVEPERRDLARRSWAAAGVGEAAVATAGFVALLGIFSELELCLGGCPPGDSGVEPVGVILLGSGATILVAGLYATAYVSRKTTRDALVHGSLANAAAAAAVLLVSVPLGAEGFAPGLVLAVGAAAGLAVREPARSARYLRIAAIVALTLTASVDDNLALVLVALFAFPAIGTADTVALRLEADAER